VRPEGRRGARGADSVPPHCPLLCPAGDLQSGHGPAGEQDGKEEPPGQQQPAGHPNESHSDNVPWYVRTIKEKVRKSRGTAPPTPALTAAPALSRTLCSCYS